MNTKYYIYVSILLISELLPILTSLVYYRRTKNSKVLFLFLWFLLHFSSDFSASVYVELIGTDTLPFGIISTFIETFLILRYAQLHLGGKRYIWVVLYILPVLVFFLEVNSHGTLNFVSFYVNMTNQSLSTLLLMIINFKTKQNTSELKFNQWLLGFHMVIFFYVANLDFLRTSENLIVQVYPYFLSVVVVFHAYAAYYFFTKLKNHHAY
jgi:hypothetical protein